jgi:NTE family protein
LLIHLALQKIEKLHSVYKEVDANKIFNLNPFITRKKDGVVQLHINHFNVLRSFARGNKTFGESKSLRAFLGQHITAFEFESVKQSDKDILITVSNLSKNQIEYKSIKDCTYDDFLDWIWISANYIPFMSLVSKEGFEYADGGLGSIVSVERAIEAGATEIDVIVLRQEDKQRYRLPTTNAFDLMLSLFGFSLDQIEEHNISLGSLRAKADGVKLNFIYTPTLLTQNPLLFDQKRMVRWWQRGYLHAQRQFESASI